MIIIPNFGTRMIMKFGPVFHKFRAKLLTNKLEVEARIKYANLYSYTICGVILCYLLCYAILTRKEQHSFFYLPNLIPLRMNFWFSSNCGGILCYSVMLCYRHFLYKYLKACLSLSCDPLDFFITP